MCLDLICIRNVILCVHTTRVSQKSLIEMYTDILNLLTDFDAKLNRKDGKFVNTLPQVCMYVCYYPFHHRIRLEHFKLVNH